MKKLPISIQTFENIINGDMIYVDKTQFLWEMISKGKYYFFARPRRFGKSLTLTTLKAYFQGKKELFKGLFIYDKETEWKEYPIIHIDYSLVEYKRSRDIFEKSLLNHLNSIGSDYGIKLKNTIIADAFGELTKALFEKFGEVVVLVDEYDKAMVDLLNKEERFAENREVLSNLYGAMKGLDKHFRFVMLTGVSRFAKVNVFSGMNNLEDISMDEKYATLAGFTQEELELYFGEWLKKLNDHTFQMSPEKLMEYIKYWYNGFCFDGNHRMYNPFSVVSLFSRLDFDNFWFSSGTPTFLINLITEQKQLPETFEGIKVADLTGSTTNIKNLPLLPLLYQTGYLTIDKVEREGIRKYYYLDYPNEEVRYSFLTYLAAGFVEKDQYEIQPEALALRDFLKEERTEKFITHLQSFFADIPARLHIQQEAYYHSLSYLMLRLVGVQLFLEKETDKGRIDAVLDLPDKIYIIEFKFGKKEGRIKNVKTLSRNALNQIKQQKYYEPYLSSKKKIILFGVGFLDKVLHGRVEEISGD